MVFREDLTTCSQWVWWWGGGWLPVPSSPVLPGDLLPSPGPGAATTVARVRLAAAEPRHAGGSRGGVAWHRRCAHSAAAMWRPTGKPFASWGPSWLFLPLPLCEMSLLHATPQSRIPRPYLDIKEIDLIVSPLKQAFNSILWGLKTLLNNWAAKRLVISVFIAHIDLSVVNPFKYPCHTGPDGSL